MNEQDTRMGNEKIGSIALTGLGVSAPLILIISAFSMFVGGGGAPLAAIALGKNDKEEAEKILGTGVVILTAISILLTAIVFIFKEPLLYIFGASEVTYQYANEYTSIYLLGTIFVQFALGLNLFITSQGQSKIAMFSVLIGAITNIILDPIFIFVFNMGVSGAAIATVLSQALSAVFVVHFLCSKKSLIRIKKEYLRLDLDIALLRKVFLLIPLALLLPRYFGVMGIFYSEPIADIISATTSGFLLFFSMKHIKKVFK